MKLHPSITVKVIEDAVLRRMQTLDNPGFCIECGNEADGCEPDAREMAMTAIIVCDSPANPFWWGWHRFIWWERTKRGLHY